MLNFFHVLTAKQKILSCFALRRPGSFVCGFWAVHPGQIVHFVRFSRCGCAALLRFLSIWRQREEA